MMRREGKEQDGLHGGGLRIICPELKVLYCIVLLILYYIYNKARKKDQ